MRRARSSRSVLALAAVVALLGAGCARQRVSSVFDVDPTGDVNYDPGKDAVPTPPKGSTRQVGFLEITVSDQNGLGRTGITVRYAGLPRQGKVVTGDGGFVRIAVPPGDYGLEIRLGCVGRYQIFDATRNARAGVALGKTTKAPMLVTVRPRYDFVSPTTWSPEPPWGPNKTITYLYSVYDQCKEKDAANLAFDWMQYRPGPIVRLVGTNVMRSDGESFARVHFRCVGSGDPTLFIVNRDDPSENKDLLTLRAPFDPGSDRCA